MMVNMWLIVNYHNDDNQKWSGV